MHIREQNRYILFKEFTSGIGGPDAGDSNGTGECERRENPPGCGRPAAGVVQHPPRPPRALPAIPPPRTKEPVPPQAFEPLFPKELIRQEMSPNRAEPIPEELREAYLRLGRPTPLYRAKRLEAFLKTPARIYYKREDLSPVGSHKPNTAFAQAYFAAQEGVEALATETGAGQWGSALALATNYFGLKAKVFMVRVSYDQKPYRKYVMNLYGADVIPSPSDQTNVGRKFLAQDPDHPGSLGIAISEAIESAVTSPNTRYS